MNELGAMLDESDPLFAVLRQRTEQVVAALPAAPEHLLFHAEFFRTPRGDTVLCEIACRPGGGEIVEMMEHAFGVNLYEAALKGQAGRYDEITTHARPRWDGWGWLPRRRGVLREIRHAPFPSRCRYTCRARSGAFDEAPGSMADILASTVFTVDGADVLPELSVLDDGRRDSVRWNLEAQR